MSACIETPPAGWHFIAYGDLLSHGGTGLVISVLGSGALFCRFDSHASLTHRVVEAREIAQWHFFETPEAFSAATKWSRK